MVSQIDLLSYCTSRIDILNVHKNIIGSGTGFIYSYEKIIDEKNCLKIFLVSNKHVFHPAYSIKFNLHIQNENQDVIIGHDIIYEVTNERLKQTIYHPNTEIDLAILDITYIFLEAEKKNINLYRLFLEKSIIPTSEEWENLNSMEEVVMIGYPNGLWDQVNNLPLIRKGVTSSNPAIDFNGKKEFVIDAACFPGSSGSPVFLFNTGSYLDKSSCSFKIDLRIKFIGILHSGPIMNAQGQVLNYETDFKSGDLTSTKVLINLGYVIKSPILEEMRDLISF